MSYGIFIVSYSYDRYIKGDMGGHRKVLELARNLNSMGHHASVFFPHYERFVDKPDVRIVLVKSIDLPYIRPVAFGFFLFFKLCAEAFKNKPDILYARPIRSLIPLIFSRIFGVFSFYELNGNPYQDFKSKSGIKYALVRFVNGINFRYCKRLIAITRRIKELLVREHRINPDKIEVIESATEPEHFKPSVENARNKLGIPENACVIGFAGTLFEYQGVGLLVQAAQKIASEVKNAVFLIVGEGECRAGLEYEVKQKGLEKSFIFTGQVAYKDVPDYINAMDICVAPFLADRDEVSPLKLYDYLACGKPVVISAIEPLKSVLAETKGIMPFKPNDISDLAEKIITLAKDGRLSSALGVGGRNYILNGHTWRQSAEKLVLIYKDAAGINP